MHKIFISYRRKGSEAITGRIRDRLVAHYGADSIFVDIDNIPAGADFRQRIAEVLETVVATGLARKGEHDGQRNYFPPR